MAADPNYDPTEFHLVFNNWLARTGLSQMAAGHTIGVSQGIVNRWMKPRGNLYLVQPSVEALEKLAPHINIPIFELKRMCGRLSPVEIASLSKRPGKDAPQDRDIRLESLFNEIRAEWPELDEPSREHGMDISRVGFKLHRPKARRSRRNSTGPDQPEPRRTLLTVTSTA